MRCARIADWALSSNTVSDGGPSLFALVLVVGSPGEGSVGAQRCGSSAPLNFSVDEVAGWREAEPPCHGVGGVVVGADVRDERVDAVIS